jgi:Fic family protein
VQNHIDGRTTDPASARYVPPPPQYVPDAIEALVAYLGRDKPNTPLLVEAAWAHYQFESVHPFLDGNGRVGRLLIPLLLASRRRLSHPLLYLSPYFDRHRTAYYDHLLAVSTDSDWLGWLRFFLQGVREQADEAIRLARAIIALGEAWKERLDGQSANRTAHRLAEFVLQHTAVDARSVENGLGVSTQTAYSAIAALERAGILREFTGRSRGRVYTAPALVDLLEPLPPGAR